MQCTPPFLLTALKKAGVKGIVFDKDNCLTAPYADVLHPSLLANWASCKSEFGTDRILIYSNWAGSADDEVGHVGYGCLSNVYNIYISEGS